MKPALALALGLLLSACSEPRTVEQEIIAVIKEMEELGEAGERSAFMGHVHQAFSAQQGQMLRDDFRRFMILQWNRNQRLQARLFPIRVTDDGNDQASAAFKVLVTGGRGLIPERGQVYEVYTIWQRDDDDWLLWRADWKPVDFQEAFRPE